VARVQHTVAPDAPADQSAESGATADTLIPDPPFRRLRVFAVDPGSVQFNGAVINETRLEIPWEKLDPGPKGDYIEVMDRDEDRRRLHEPPVDLDSIEILAQDGLAPSDGNPQFRQQMVYAVAMNTIHAFERALGRPAHWAQPADKTEGYRARLRIYPHFTEADESRYDQRRGICLSYFKGPSNFLVFSCLSQDAIAHSVTDALLDGTGIDFGEPGSEGWALHNAFCDLVALFQHFNECAALRRQIGEVSGRIEKHPTLGAYALQIGREHGYPDGLRNAFGSTRDGKWQPHRPDPRKYADERDPRMKTEFLMAAVFDAFRKIYDARVEDLRRIASGGTGVLPDGCLHPDLVRRMTHEASDAAREVLQMCIRALDYLPPTEPTFTDFLRAVVTGDCDLAPEDPRQYRVAFIEAFRAYGMLPPDLGTLSPDTLTWRPRPEGMDLDAVTRFASDQAENDTTTHWTLPTERDERWAKVNRWRTALRHKLADSRSEDLAGIDLTQSYDITAIDLRERAGAAGTVALQWVMKFAQPATGASCTLLVDAESGDIRYVIPKPAGAQDGGLLERATSPPSPSPSERSLRVFASDPTAGVELETAGINEVTLQVPWETELEAGPVGEYLEVIDIDPASGVAYKPVDLNSMSLVAQDGLPPSEANPQFHQQMVYAVTMRVIRDFERSLGRLALWAPHRHEVNGKYREDYVQRLRVHPHALREANAYYSPGKVALLFGYFPADRRAEWSELTVFTALSHDVIAHEATHALLDGIHRRFNEDSNPDVLAFHEAFADIVALFEHFSMPEVLRHQIAATRGDLESQNQLGALAQQFGQATGKRGALRDAIGHWNDETGKWERTTPNPERYATVMEPHDRGAILVAAVFDAFLTIYKSRIRDLLRIASEGTGVLPEGELHPDLVGRLAGEAARAARQVLDMCIRALDYCPPVDIEFGDYLRAIITADYEDDPVDRDHRRVAFVESFRRYGIEPDQIRSFSVEGLRWRCPAEANPAAGGFRIKAVTDKKAAWDKCVGSWNLAQDRKVLFNLMRNLRKSLHNEFKNPKAAAAALQGSLNPELPVEVHSLRPSTSVDWDGKRKFRWIIELTQREKQWYDDEADEEAEEAGEPAGSAEGGNGAAPAAEQRTGEPDYWFRGGCTLVVDPSTGEVIYSITKLLNDDRREKQRKWVNGSFDNSLAGTYFGRAGAAMEPFAMVHR
jgi:hypothetical protein